VTIETPLITASDVGVRHILRDKKQTWGKVLPVEIIHNLPRLLADPKAVLLDVRPGDNSLLYAFDAADRSGKLVVRLSFREGGDVFNRVISGGLVPTSSLCNKSAYTLLSGKI
jgi:hypothetical protein